MLGGKRVVDGGAKKGFAPNYWHVGEKNRVNKKKRPKKDFGGELGGEIRDTTQVRGAGTRGVGGGGTLGPSFGGKVGRGKALSRRTNHEKNNHTVP